MVVLKRKRGNVGIDEQRQTKRRALESDNILDEDESPGSSSDEGESSEDGGEAHGPVAPEKTKAQASIPKGLPSAQELRTIFEASELFKSNSFKLQIDNLLPTVAPKTSKTARAPLETFLLQLHEFLMNLADTKPSQPAKLAASLKKNGFAVPFPAPAPTSETNWKFLFSKPSAITLVGSWAQNLSVKHKDGYKFVVDVAVDMPSTMFQEKDYLNDRYFHKRALYLAYLAKAITSKFPVEGRYESPNQDIRGTTLVLSPKPNGDTLDWSKLNAEVRILPTLPTSESSINTTRFAPKHSNLRVADVDPTTPTPIYNNALALSQLPVPLLLEIHNLITEVPNTVPAISLLRIWANQRGFGKGKKVIRGFEALGSWWPCVIMYLVRGGAVVEGLPKSKRRTIGKGLSSYQLFRATLDFFSSHDFENEPVFVKGTSSTRKLLTASDWTSYEGSIFVDPTGTVNLLASVPFGSLFLLREEAARTLQMLNDSSTVDTFGPAFLQDLREAQTVFDVVIRVGLEGARLADEDRLSILQHGSYINALLSSFDKVLRKSLGDRVRAVAIVHATSTSRSLSEDQPVHPATIDIGLVLDPANAWRLVDHGPPPDEHDSSLADGFRAFWGEKAELRRFNDGAIRHSVVWAAPTPEEKQNIPIDIIKYVLGLHFNIKKVDSTQLAYDPLCRLPSNVSTLLGTPSSTTGFRNAMQAFDQLVKDIKAMELPLSLAACLPIADGLRYTSVIPPSPPTLARLTNLPACAKYIPVYECILQFEKSARWPDNLGAIQKLKLAWFENIANLLTQKYDGAAKVSVAIDNSVSPIADNASVEVVLSSGFAFRFRIYHDREKTLLDRTLNDKTATPFDKREAQEALDTHLLRFVYSPRHHSAILNMHHKYPAYSPTVRLVKRWLAAHFLLDIHISSELVEILVAYVFLRPDDSLPIPHTAPTGFARTTAFLKQWDWRMEPIMVPLYSVTDSVETDEKAGREPMVTFPSSKREIADKAFKEARTLDPGMSRGAWFVVADDEGVTGGNAFAAASIWSSSKGGLGPTPMIADRIKVLAKATWECIEAGMDSGSLSVKALFQHPLEEYDFKIYLDPAVLPTYTLNLSVNSSIWKKDDKHFVNLNTVQDENPLVGFNPAMLFIRDLQRVYGDTILFFMDSLGGTVITGSFNPSIDQPKPFRALLGYSTLPAGDKKAQKKGNVVLNKSAVLAEIARMGQGLVKEIVAR